MDTRKSREADKCIYRYFLYLYILVLPLYPFTLINLEKRTILWGWIIIVFLLLSYIIALIKGKLELIIYRDNVIYGLVFLNFCLLLSGIEPLFSNDLTRLIDFFTIWAQFVLFSFGFFIFIQMPFSKATFIRALQIFVLVGIVVASFGIFQVIVENVFEIPVRFYRTNIKQLGYTSRGYVESMNFKRALAFFSEARHFGNFLILPFFILLYSSLLNLYLFRPLSRKIGISILLLGIVASLSASTYMSLIVCSIMMFVLEHKLVIRKYGKYIIILLIGVFFHFQFFSSLLPVQHVLNRFMLSNHEWQNLFNYDVHLWGLPRYIRGIHLSLYYAWTHPITGTGLNQFHHIITHDVIVPSPMAFLQGIGIFGFLVFLFFIGSIFVGLIRLRRFFRHRDRNWYQVTSIALFIIMTLMWLPFATGKFNYNSTWFWLGIYLSSIIYFRAKSIIYKGQNSGSSET